MITLDLLHTLFSVGVGLITTVSAAVIVDPLGGDLVAAVVGVTAILRKDPDDDLVGRVIICR